jgi:hypothetical protein
VRVALVGEGPLPGPDSVDTAFAQLRLHQFHAALRADGHDVHVLDAAAPDLSGDVARVDADVVVSAGTWAPVRAAVHAAGPRPLCVDLPGDPFADLQAALHAPGSAAWAAGPQAAARAAARVFLPALERADAFTTIGPPARWALLGQLGVLGRLGPMPPGEEPVFVTPNAWGAPGLEEAPPRAPAPGTPLSVVLFGGVNTWMDAQATARGLVAAAARVPVRVTVIGGPVPGHHEAGAARLRTLLDRDAPGLVRWLPRLPASALGEEIARHHVLAWVDRPGVEPETGSRTRALLAVHQGLRVVATARCALVQNLVAGGWATPVPEGGDPAEGLADALVAVANVFPSLPDRAPLRAAHAIAATTRGLRAWVADPRRAPPAWGDGPLARAARWLGHRAR